ncbi:DUF1648 domain-containing protein [Micrococcus porci]|uniref:DUF1648 domain-containing protein n=1 Tax=Micrococcus porci TaxID=2856555 RepID=UPI001CC8EF50|nr:DUF1648 domain-containing protein [Micrococcus porci]UBH24766.1 DUF1648 domain-containing protein [Micrococcus porci]
MPHPPRPTPDDVPAAERAALRRGRWIPWLPYLLTAAVSAGLLVWAIVALPGLPDRVPVHWGIDGRPDAWEEKSFGTVAFGPLLGLGMTALLAFCAALTPAMTATPQDASPWRRVRQEGVNRGVREALGWLTLLIALATAPSTVEVLSNGAWRPAWWLMPLVLTLVMLGTVGVFGPALRRWTGWADRTAQDLGYRADFAELAEDAKWTPLGLKNDPEDPSAFPAKREGYGVGATVNLATTTGRLLVYGFVALFVIGLPAALWIGAFLNR